MRNGTARILTAVVGIPLVVLLTYAGGYYFVGMVALIGFAAQYEFYSLQRFAGWTPAAPLGLLGGLVVLTRIYGGYFEAIALVGVLLLLVDLLTSRGAGHPLTRLAGTLAGVVYPAWLISYLSEIRIGLESGLGSRDAFVATMMLVTIVWVSDTAAYYVGKSIGRRRLAPTISPGKTREGSLGGLIGAFVAGSVFKILWLPVFSWQDVAILALIGGLVSQIGDLIESRFKRAVDIKDSASLLPGHGGFLDRFDGMIVAVPLYYLYLVFGARLIP